MQTITNTFSALGTTLTMTLQEGDSLLYKFDALASWNGTVVLRRTRDGGMTYEVIETFTATDNDGTRIVGEGVYSFECRIFTAGSAKVTMIDLSNDLGVPEVGLPSGVTVFATEDGDGVTNKTILDLIATPVSVTSITTGAGVGGTKIYDFPQGRILMLGCMSDLSVGISSANQASFTNATPEGDVGVGSAAPADADALGTDATDDNMSTAVPFIMADYNDPSVQSPSEASLQFDGTVTPLDMYVNALVDAIDIDDSVTSELLVSGKIVFHWVNLGDF